MKRGLNHKNSLPDPEFGGESSESARAIHYVVQKDTLMTYVSALIAQADLRKLRGSTIERKQMSTKTIYKRIALVAVASLGFGVLTSVSPASADDSTATVSIAPIRVSFTGTTQDLVDRATVTLTADAEWAAGDVDTTNDDTSFTVTLTQAPTAAAQLSIAAAGDTGTVVLGTPDTLVRASGEQTSTSVLTALSFGANVAGTYRGTIAIDGNANASTDLLNASFVFTTVGAPTSFDFTSDVASSAVSGAITTKITLRDAASNITQGSTVDTFDLTVAIAGTATVGTLAAASATSANLADGVHENVYTNSVTAGSTSTLTATPRGTLGSLSAKTLVVTTVAASTGVPKATIEVSNTTVVDATNTTTSLNAYTVAPNQTSVTFKVTGLTPNASFTYDITSSGGGTFTSVNGIAYTGGVNTTVVSTATGTYDFVVIAASPAAQTITLDLNTDNTNDVTGQVDAQYTYAAGVYAVKASAPAAGSLFATSAPITYTGKIADQFGNALAGANVLVTGTPVPATTPATITGTAVTAADGSFTVTLAATVAATTSMGVAVTAAKSGVSATITALNDTVYFTATGKAATLVLTDTDTVTTGVTTTDNKSSRTIPKTIATGADDSLVDLIDTDVSATDNQVSITPQTTLPGTIGYTATATNGIRLKTTTMTGALVTGSSITGTGGTAFFAVPTKVGVGVITVVSGGLTQTFELTGVLPTTPRTNLVTLTAGTTAGTYTVTTTDGFGNGVSANVAISVSGPGEFSNGFKNLTVTTAAVTGTNTFSIVSSVASATTITASIAADGNYTALVAADVTTYGLVAASAAATATLAGLATSSQTTTIATLTTLVNSLIAKINALNKLVIKIQKKVRA